MPVAKEKKSFETKDLLEVEHVELQGTTDIIKLKVIEGKDNSVAVDIRRYYVDKSDGEYKPTAKGLRINTIEKAQELLNQLQELIEKFNANDLADETTA